MSQNSTGVFQASDKKRHKHELKSLHDEDGPAPVSFAALFRLATKGDRALITFGIIICSCAAFSPLVINIMYGEFANMLMDRTYPKENVPSSSTVIMKYFGGGKILINESKAVRSEILLQDCMAWGVGCFLVSFVQTILIMAGVFMVSYSASRQIRRMKTLFFISVLCKDLSWFDLKMRGNYLGSCYQGLRTIEKGMGEILAVFIYQSVAGLTNLVISYIYGWLLSLILSLLMFPLMVPIYIQTKIQNKLSGKEFFAFNKAGNVIEEVLTHIKTVVAFEGEKKELLRYASSLQESKKIGMKREAMVGISQGVLWFIIYNCYTIALLVGFRVIIDSRENKKYHFTPGDLFTVFFGMVAGMVNLGFGSAYISGFSDACSSASHVFHIMFSKSKINSCSKDGTVFKSFFGDVEFKNVYFEYPLHPKHRVLKGINFKVKPGEIVAVVGEHSTGKSTILNLIQRFYDPSYGAVYLDGYDIVRLNVNWIRRQMGLVLPDPFLFHGTISENIIFGNIPTTEREVHEAAKNADCHDFIMKLEQDYDTVYDKSTLFLTRSQKQRIVLARAILKNPKILLLDDVTFKMDSSNESSILQAVERVIKNRTTFIATSKISTISHADRILVIEDGAIVEEGAHDDLMEAKGLYYRMVRSGKQHQKEKSKPPEPQDKSILEKSQASLNKNEEIEESDSPRESSIETALPPVKNDSFLEQPPVSYNKIIKWSRPDWCYIITGLVSAVIGGTALPAACYLFGDAFGVLSKTDFDVIRTIGDTYSIYLVGIATVAGVCNSTHMLCFTKAAVNLGYRLRIQTFKSILKQEIAWFEEQKQNKAHAIRLGLSQDPHGVQMGVGSCIGVCVQSVVSMSIALGLSFYIDWRVALVTLATLPVLLIGTLIETSVLKEPSPENRSFLQKATEINTEAVTNIKLVISYNTQEFYLKKFISAENKLKKLENNACFYRALGFAFGQTTPFFCYSVALWYGGTLVAEDNLHIAYPIIISELLIFGAWTLTQCIVFTPFFSEAKKSAGRLTYIFKRKPLITDGDLNVVPDVKKDGIINYSKVFFSYPSHPEIKVLQNLNLVINCGENVALVGPSSSGKTSILYLLLRFYDPKSGNISVNNVDIKKFKLSNLRKKLGILMQEPVIFNRTVKENIAYGDNSRKVTMREIEKAAQAANIHEFIKDLPNGYETHLSSVMNKLTKEQKQKLAIARILIRKPQILLVDNGATALDAKSEEIFFKVLEKNFRRKGRTVVRVGTKLKRVNNIDNVNVISEGTVKEYGSPAYLMHLKGLFYLMQGEKTEETANPGTSKT